MQNFLIEEFDHYKTFLYSRPIGEAQVDMAIDIKLPSGRVHIYFCQNDGLGKNHVEGKDNHKLFHIYVNSSLYPNWIDILRNESPLFFYYDYDRNFAYITTTDEPVGEGERKHH